MAWVVLFGRRLPAEGPLRPQLGGTSPGPGPTGTPGTGGSGSGGGGGGEATTPEQYAAYLVLLTSAVFALIGFFMGVKRAFIAFIVTLGAALVFGRLWDPVAALLNRLFKLTVFAFRGGPFGSDPVAAWNEVKDMAALVPSTGPAVAMWQLTLFTIAVLLGYLLAFVLAEGPGGVLNLRGVATWMSRLFGALFGGLTGATIALFVLPRLFPEVVIDMSGVVEVLVDVIGNYGVYLFWFFVVLIIIAGLLALRPKPSSRVFN